MNTALLSLSFLLAGQPTLASPPTPSPADSPHRCTVPAGVPTLTVEIAVAPGQRVVEVEGGRITHVEFGPAATPEDRGDPRVGRTTPEMSTDRDTSTDSAATESDAHALLLARWANAERRVRELEERLKTHADTDPRDARLVQLRGELSQLASERDHWEASLRAEGWTPPAEPMHTTRLVVGPKRITIDGLEVTWKEIPRLMRYWPDRRESTLLVIPGPEVATRSEAIELGHRIQELAEETYFQAALLDLDNAKPGSDQAAAMRDAPSPQADTKASARATGPSAEPPPLTPAPTAGPPALDAPPEPPARPRPDATSVPPMDPPPIANGPDPALTAPRATTPLEPAPAATAPAKVPSSHETAAGSYRALIGMQIERLSSYMERLEEIAARVEAERGRTDATAAARREALRLHQREFDSLLASAEQEYIRSVELQTATVYPTDRQLSWSDLVEILPPARDRLLELGNRFDAQVAATQPDADSQLTDPVQSRLRVRRFVRLVDGPGEDSLDGVPTNSKEMSRALAVPTDREETVLEIAVSPRRAEALDAADRARIVRSLSNLADALTYEEVADVGDQPLGSLGSLPQVLVATPVCSEHGPQAAPGPCPHCGRPTETEWTEFAAERDQPR